MTRPRDSVVKSLRYYSRAWISNGQSRLPSDYEECWVENVWRALGPSRLALALRDVRRMPLPRECFTQQVTVRCTFQRMQAGIEFRLRLRCRRNCPEFSHKKAQ